MPIAYRWDTLLNVVYGAFSYVDVSQYAMHIRSNVDFTCESLTPMFDRYYFISIIVYEHFIFDDAKAQIYTKRTVQKKANELSHVTNGLNPIYLLVRNPYLVTIGPHITTFNLYTQSIKHFRFEERIFWNVPCLYVLLSTALRLVYFFSLLTNSTPNSFFRGTTYKKKNLNEITENFRLDNGVLLCRWCRRRLF